MAAKKKKQQRAAKVSGEGMTPNEHLSLLTAECNKALGVSGAVYLGLDAPPFSRLRTGIIALDYVLGGGVVRGQMVQFTGGDSAFKTTAALITVATVQADDPGAQVVWVAGEGFSRKWARRWGVQLDRTFVVTAATGDTAMETAMTLMESGHVTLMVIDSFQSLGTEREMEGGVDSESYAGAGAPQMWGRVMRRAYAAMNRGANTALIGISQVRSKIGGFSGGYGPPDPEGTGIWALKHWKAADIYFKKGELFYEGDASEKRVIKGREYKLRCPKNKTAVAERVASFSMHYDGDTVRVDNAGTLLRLAAAFGVVERRGAWIQWGKFRAQGEDAFVALLAKKRSSVIQLEEEVMAVIAESEE